MSLDEDYLDNKKFKLAKTFGVIVILAGHRPTWERVNKVIDKLLPLLKDIAIDSLRCSKIAVSLEGYVKVSLIENKIVKEEFKW